MFNYLTCVVTGTIFSGGPSIFYEIEYSFDWIWVAALMGLLFITTFYIMAMTAQKVSVAIATVASKISLIIPVLISILWINKNPESFSAINYLGIALVLAAIYLVTKKNTLKKGPSLTPTYRILLIASVFLCTGAVDTLLNVAEKVIDPSLKTAFPIILFGVAGLLGVIALSIQLIQGKTTIKWRSIVGGLYLGIPNYFSIYFLVNTLTDYKSDGAVVYPIVNMSVIIVSSLGALFIFKEQLSKTNYIGIIVAIVGIACISWEELF